MWLQVHGIDAWERPGVLRTRAVEQASFVTAVSRYSRKRLLAWARIQPSQVKVLPNTIGDRFSPGPKPSHLLERHGLRDKNVLLTVGRLSSAERYKGHDLVIRAMPELLQQDSSYRYVITGDGNDRSRLEKIANEMGVTGQVIFTGQVTDAELPDYYRLADTFVMPSIGEGFGIVFLEAARSGLAVIGGNQDGSVDALREGVLGKLVPPKPDSVSLAIIKENTKYSVEKDAAIFGVEYFRNRVSEIARTELFSECGETGQTGPFE